MILFSKNHNVYFYIFHKCDKLLINNYQNNITGNQPTNFFIKNKKLNKEKFRNSYIVRLFKLQQHNLNHFMLADKSSFDMNQNQRRVKCFLLICKIIIILRNGLNIGRPIVQGIFLSVMQL